MKHKMKYKRGTILKFTAKALRAERVKDCGITPNHRCIVLDASSVILFNMPSGEVEELGMFKTQDSFVECSNETLPKLWMRKIRQVELLNRENRMLAREFKITVRAR